MKIQIDIPETLNSKLKVYKQLREQTTLSESIIQILEEKFKDNKLRLEIMEFMKK